MSREHLVDEVLELAMRTGWQAVHQRPARTANSYRTAVAGHAGFPDIAIARRGTIRFLECKGPTGKPTLEQLDWLQALGNRASLVRPCDWDPWIVPLLTGRDPGHAAPTLQWDGDTWTGTLATWAGTQHNLPRKALCTQ